MLVESWPVDRVKPYERNPRVNDGAVDAVAKSLAEFGFRQPLVVDTDGVLIVGHTRWTAAKQIGLTEVPVLVAQPLQIVGELFVDRLEARGKLLLAGFAATRRSRSKQAVIDEILDRYHAGRSLSSGRAENTNLAAVAIRYFGSWRQAIAAAGLPSQRTDNKGA